MHNSGPSEVMKALSQRGKEVAGGAHGGEETIRAPGPVTDDGVDESGNGDAIQKIADEAGASDHRARSDGRACVGERELEDPERKERHAGALIRSWNIFQEEPVISDQSIAVA